MENQMDDQRKNIGMFILDVLKYDDAESVTSILKMINDEGCIGWKFAVGREITREEVLSSLQYLLNAGNLVLLHECEGKLIVKSEQVSDGLGDLWFALTEKGKEAWAAWNPPMEETIKRERIL